MSETTPNAGGDALSVDAAVSLLTSPVEQEQEQAPEDAPQEAAPEAEEIEAEPSAETPEEEAETPDPEETEGDETPVEAVEPPRYWAKDAKEAFAKLPPELQAVVLAQEGPREEAAAKAKQEAAEVRQKADQEIAQINSVVERLNQFLPDAIQRHQSKWDNIDWTAWAKQDPEGAIRGRFEFEQEQANLKQIAEAKAQAETVAFQKFLAEEVGKLAGTPLEAEPVRQEVGKYLLDTGISQDALRHVSAAELTIAHKAMMWDRAQAQLKSKPPVVKPAAPPKPAAKPAAAPVQSSAIRTATEAKNRFSQTRAVDDAVALLLAMDKKR